ncbi:MAG: DUF2730 domain-containing protein [Deltaproteobacteria bacterium]|nr:DUF2730 domain-containing protein [Deltaproteobacteria bacterium]
MSTENFSEYRFWLDLAQWAATLAIGWGAWQTAQHRIGREHLEELEQRLARMETEIGHIPNQTNLRELAVRIETVHGELKRIGGEMKGMRRTMELVSEKMIKG